MKMNTISLTTFRRSWLAVAALAGSLFLSAVTAPTAHAADGNPPDRISYKGFLIDASGDPLEPGGPLNHTIIFRIYDVLLGGTALWTEQQTVTIDNGVFSVLLGAGTGVGSESHDLLHTVFQGNNASHRYIGITVDGGVELAPRMRFLTSPYAHLASNAITANSLNGGVVNTVNGGGIFIDNSVAVPAPRVGTWDPSYRDVLKATQGIWDWNVLMNKDNGNLVWADANATTGGVQGPEEMVLNGAGDLFLRGNVTSATGGFIVSNASVSPILQTTSSFPPQLKRIYSAHRNTHQWVAMINEQSGAIEWGADRNALSGTAVTQLQLSKSGDLHVLNAVYAPGLVARSSGLLVENAGHTPAARTGAFSPNAKRIYSATVGHRDWHAFFNADDGNLLWSDGNVDGDAHSEMYLTPVGRLVVEDGISINNATTTPPLYSQDWKGVLSANVGGKAWHIMMDNVGAGNLIFGDDVDGSYEMFLGRGSGHLNIKGNLTQASDRRLKRNIENFGSGVLERFVALRPVKYNWKRDEDNEPKDFGLIAQDVRKLFPEVVSVSESGDPEVGGMLGISYNKLGVLAVSAIKELQDDTKREDALLHEEVKSLREENSSLSDQLREMQSRLEVLEQNFL
jgi:hypothetical protein